MKKENLKDGMIIVYGDGSFARMVSGNDLLDVDGKKSNTLSHFNNDLTHYNDADFDIKEVYQPSVIDMLDLDSTTLLELTEHLTPIWKRKKEIDWSSNPTVKIPFPETDSFTIVQVTSEVDEYSYKGVVTYCSDGYWKKGYTGGSWTKSLAEEVNVDCKVYTKK